MFEKSKISLGPITEEEIQKIGFKSSERWKKWFEIFVGVNIVVTTQVTIESMIHRKPFIMAYLENEKAEDLIYCGGIIIVNIIFMLSTITTVLGYEGSFIYFIAYSVAEMRMIKLGLENCALNSERDRNKFSQILEHHVHVLR